MANPHPKEAMSTSIYDADRLDKIRQIMPTFAEACEVGDEVVLGLEGDPLFPAKYRSSRPAATIVSKDTRDGEICMKLRLDDGSTREVSQHTINPAEVFEYTAKQFEKVMERETEKQEAAARAERANLNNTSKTPSNAGSSSYRGSTDELNALRSEVATLRDTTQNFQNTIISSLQELSRDVLKIDKVIGDGNRAEFAKVFCNEYQKHNEPSFRGRKAGSVTANSNIFSDSESMGENSDSDA